MGEVIKKTAAVEDIHKDVITTLVRARERGSPVKEIAEARLGPHEKPMADAAGVRKLAVAAEELILARLLAADVAADAETGAVADEVWNKFGRPAKDGVFDGLFPGGVQTYTRPAPRREALLLAALVKKLATTKDPRVAPAAWEAWSKRIATVQKPLDLAAREHELAEAETFLADQVYRATVHTAWFDMPRTKRDFQNAGLNEADIHLIIPDRPPPHEDPKTS